MLARPFLILALLTSAASAAPSVPDADKAVLKKHCTNDYLNYCGNFAPDSAELAACFKTNMTKFAPGCQAAITAYEKKGRSARAAN